MAPPQEINFRIGALFFPDIKNLLEKKDFRELHHFLKTISPIDLADIWADFSEQEKTILFRLLCGRDSVSLFQELDAKEQTHLLNTMGDNHIEDLVSDLKPEEKARLFHRLPARTVKSMTRFVQQDQQASIDQLLTYPESSVGNWMHFQRVDLKAAMTSQQAITKIQTATQLRKSNPDGYYVTDKENRVVGFVYLREIVASPSSTKLSEYMHPTRMLRLLPTQDQEDAIQLFTKYKLSMAPVVDESGKLLGYIQAEDIIPLVQKESTEDIQKLGAVEALDEPYFKIHFSKMIKKRGSWLLVLFLGELLTATAMGFFEHAIAKAVVLALFIPLIISSGGNSGSQAATLVVRAMALKEITFKDWWRVMRRELASGLVLGSILGSIGFLRIFLWSMVSPIYGPHYLLVACTVGIALVLVVMWGTLSGSLLPLVLNRVGLDPAVVSAPFVATLVDVTGLVIYFSTALVLLKDTLL